MQHESTMTGSQRSSEARGERPPAFPEPFPAAFPMADPSAPSPLGDSEPVGLIGLGLLGLALAQRWLEQGRPVVGFDRQPDRIRQLVRGGGSGAATPGELVAGCRYVAFCLPDSRVVVSVVESLGADLPAGRTVVDFTTGDPQDTTAVAEQLAGRRIDYLDATVAGSSVQARQGQILLLVGGKSEAVARCQPLLQALTSQVHHLGPSGSGARMKLVLNLVLGLNRAVLAEGLTLADSLGLDLQAVLHVLQAGPAASQVMATKGQKMLAGDFTPQARLAQHLKDVRLIRQAAARAELTLPLTDVHQRLLERAVARGFGDSDNSAILEAFR